MSEWDVLDAKLSTTMSQKLAEAATWRPQAAPIGSVYTVEPGGVPDPNRPVQELTAIVSWAPEGLPAGVPGLQGQIGAVGEATLMVDFEAAAFERVENAAYGKPRRGDRLELPEQAPGDRLVQVMRVGDDGSGRFYAWCAIVRD